MILYRCSLTMSKDFLSGSYNAYDAQAGAGTVHCRMAGGLWINSPIGSLGRIHLISGI